VTTRVPEAFDATCEGIRVTSATFSISLYATPAPSEIGQPIVDIFERYRELVGDDTLKFYATGTMSKHKPVTKRALGMPAVWMKPGARLSDLVSVEYHDGAQFNDAPKHLWAVHGSEEVDGERITDPTVIRLSLPAQSALDDPEAMIALTTELWGMAEFRFAHAGFAFECSRYMAETAHEHAYAQSMRHPGIDIAHTANDAIMMGEDAIRGIGWLTLLDEATAERVGGSEGLAETLGDEAVVLIQRGVMLRADESPQFGDVNRKDDLPGYRAVYAAVQSLMTDTSDVPCLDIGGDFEARTEAWLTRFGS